MHTGAWVAWVTLVTVVALATTNPLYLAVLLLCILLVATLAPRTATGVASFRVMALFGSSMLAVSIVVATINGSYGDHILFTIPGPEMPEWLGGLRFGGPVSAEGFAAAGIRGLAILCIFLAFGVFSGAVSPYRVLRITPGALYYASLVLTVGLTLLPSSIEDLRRIREVRALRGARSGLRELPSLVVPAVINGLERSMQLAEAMEARGYAVSRAPGRSARFAAAASAPLLLASAWLWFYNSSGKPAGALCAAAGLAALAWWFWKARRSHAATTFTAEELPRSQVVTIVASGVVVAMIAVARAAGFSTLGYNPFAGLQMPGFTLAEAGLVASVAWPSVFLLGRPALASPPDAPVATAFAEGAP